MVNMGLIPAIAVALVRRHQGIGSAPRTALTLALACFTAMLFAALAIVVEISVGRTGAELAGLGAFTSQMLWSHMLAGVLEGAVTVAIVFALGGLVARRESPSLVPLTRKSARLVLALSLTVALAQRFWVGPG